MRTVVIVVLLGEFLCGVRGVEGPSTSGLISMVTTLQSQVKTLQDQVQSLLRQVQDQGNSQAPPPNNPVGFFAGFHTTEVGNIGPFDDATTIKYQKVMTNIGNGYSSETGIFTAPVKGLYVFHFTVFNSLFTPPKSLAMLKKNSETLATAFDVSATDPQDSITRVAVVTLEVGDTVFVELQIQSFFYDSIGNLNSFSGFLLSPM